MRKLNRLAIYAITLGLCAGGCSTFRERTIGFVPVRCPSDKALIYLYRVRRWPGPEIKMFANGIAATALHGREYSPIHVDPGQVTLAHEVKGGPLGSLAWLQDDLRVVVEPGRTYYVAYQFSANPFHGYPSAWMDLMEPHVAKNEISVCTLRRPDLGEIK